MKFLFATCLFLFSFQAFCQSEKEEKEAITATVQLYFDGMIQRDRSKLEEAFIPEARLIGYRGENFTITTFEDWANGTAKGEKRDPSKYKNILLEIELKGNTALAKTELFWPGIYYYDFLTLIKKDGQWKIVHKTWYEEKR
ncbi:nuclear transport factor 2 family protein [Cognataquiflexum rubidum]|uniref:nuclear transport factor 2 family protein n=1 Tax=Cognataquiflexum rubidum TaxID=2922273 RepID=UPI001F12F073|nr:nuclear transport factor 2 family protein [Cognataquiflexum rubidum]MCH6232694.1 nuclear transport factor 2 family protein [Cognataquiflexum rubidum]